MMLLDFLRTPMAAPETGCLKVMRWTIMVCNFAIAAVTPVLGLARASIGSAAGGFLAGLLLVLAILVPVYVRAKNRADEAYLIELVAEGEGR